MGDPDCPKVLPVRARCPERGGKSDWRYIPMKALIVYDSVFGNTEQSQATDNALEDAKMPNNAQQGPDVGSSTGKADSCNYSQK